MTYDDFSGFDFYQFVQEGFIKILSFIFCNIQLTGTDVAVRDGNWIDTFNSGAEICVYYWEDMRNGI